MIGASLKRWVENWSIATDELRHSVFAKTQVQVLKRPEPFRSTDLAILDQQLPLVGFLSGGNSANYLLIKEHPEQSSVNELKQDKVLRPLLKAFQYIALNIVQFQRQFYH
jgi:hypothetical protein